MTYKPPTYTQVPNLLLDKHVQNMSKAELKIILATCRKTFGWQKGKDRISYTQFEKLTGLSRASVQEGIKQAVANGYLRRYEVRNGFEYALAIDSIPEFGTVDDKTIPEIEHTKESILKKTTTREPVLDMLGKKDVFIEYPADVADKLRMLHSHYPKLEITSKAAWIRQARDGWKKRTVDDIDRMCKYAKEKGWGIARPNSITSAWNMINSEQSQEDIDYEKMHKAVHG